MRPFLPVQEDSEAQWYDSAPCGTFPKPKEILSPKFLEAQYWYQYELLHVGDVPEARLSP